MSLEETYIGVEGVGMRFSLAALCSSDGTVQSAFRLPEPISLHTTPQELLLERITVLLRNVLHQNNMKLSDLKRSTVCIGLTGVTFRYDREVILPRLMASSGLSFNCLIATGDAEITFASHTASTQGTAVLCHSGSTAYAVCERDKALAHVRFGGWGPAIGDEGSGFWLGRNTLRAIGEEHDRHAEPSLLWAEVRKWLELSNSSIEAWQLSSASWAKAISFLTRGRESSHIDLRTILFYFAHTVIHEQQPKTDGIESWRRIVSGLVIPLIRAAEQGDKVAQTIIQNGIAALQDQLSHAVNIAEQRLGFSRASPLVLYGGVISHHPYFRDKLIGAISESGPKPSHFVTTGSPGAMRPVCGALLFALGKSSTGALRMPHRECIEKLRLTSAEFRELANE